MRGSSLRVLYLHPASAFGGASKSLIEMYRVLAGQALEGTVLTPAGTAAQAFAAAGLDVRHVKGLSQFDNTRYGYYRGVRWLILFLRELWLFPFALAGLWRLRREAFDLIHVNDVTLLPLGVLAKYLLGIPLVVHARSLQRKPGIDWRTRWINRLLRRHADAVVAIDHTVAASLDQGLPLVIIHNGLRLAAEVPPVFEPTKSVITVGFLGVLLPLKGVFELVAAIGILKERGVRVQCLIAGENARSLSGAKAWLLRRFGFGRDVRAELLSLVNQQGLQEQVKLLGFVSDVRNLYPQLDILCFPSYLDAAGRPVFEAAFHSIPSVVAISNPMPDAVIHEVTGLAIPSPDPLRIADALQRLTEDSQLRLRLGEQARTWAEQTFSIEVNATRMLHLYQDILSKKTGR